MCLVFFIYMTQTPKLTVGKYGTRLKLNGEVVKFAFA